MILEINVVINLSNSKRLGLQIAKVNAMLCQSKIALFLNRTLV